MSFEEEPVRFLRTVLLAIMVGAATSCAAHRGALKEEAFAPMADEPVTLSVTNHNWLDVVIYVVTGTERIRLITVTAAGAGEIPVPTRALQHNGEIRLLVHAVGNPTTFMSELVVAKPGSTVEWTIESELRRSSLAVW
jgi:hypothetical protein